MAHYSASKGAIIALTKTLAHELGPLGITCNNIPPRFVMNTIVSENAVAMGNFSKETFIRDRSIRRQGEPRISLELVPGWCRTKPAMSPGRPSASMAVAISDACRPRGSSLLRAEHLLGHALHGEFARDASRPSSERSRLRHLADPSYALDRMAIAPFNFGNFFRDARPAGTGRPLRASSSRSAGVSVRPRESD